MSQNRVTGLTSAFNASATPSQQAPSGVSALASRFDAPPPATSSDPQLSEKVSGIASRFGATVADVSASPRKKGTSVEPVKSEAPEPNRVVEERPDFGAITKRFASGTAGRKETVDGEGTRNMFAAAASAWEKREEEARPQVAGKVSAFKKEFEGAKNTVEDTKKDTPIPTSVEKVVEERPAGVGSITSRFEAGALQNEEKDSEKPLANRFESAAKIFAAEDKAPEEGNDESVKNKFADAAKLFGGGQ